MSESETALLRKELVKVTAEYRDLQNNMARLKAAFAERETRLEAENERRRLKIAELNREGHASGACSLTTTAGCSRCFSGSAEASVAGASLPRLRRQTWP